MTFPPHADLERLAAAVEALRALEAAGAEPAGRVGADARAAVDAVGGLTIAQKLVRSLAALGAVRAAVDAVALQRIAALERERSFDPESDPVQAAGHPNVESLLAELWKTSAAGRPAVVWVARATAPRHTLQGDELPAEFPDLAQALLGPSTASERGGDPDCSDAVSADATGADAPAPTLMPATGPATLPVICGRGCRWSKRERSSGNWSRPVPAAAWTIGRWGNGC